MIGGSLCPGVLNERSYEPQNLFHYVQKGGDLPVVLEGSARQELVNHRQQSLQPPERRGRRSNISMSREKQETVSDRGRLSGCTQPQVNINSPQRCAQTSEHHVTEFGRGGTSYFCAGCVGMGYPPHPTPPRPLFP